MLTRLLHKVIKNSKKSVLLLGPRQTGKSTLLNSLNPDLVINLANESEFLRISSDVDYFESLILENKPQTVLVDEVQRIPSLLNTIQYLIDDKSRAKIKFLLSGSSARKLKRGKANLLPGRIFSYSLGGICPKEVDYEINFKKALVHGFLPEPYLSKKNIAEKLLMTYAATYLKEEIQAEALTRNLQGFARFLTVIARQAGQIVDFSKLSSKSKVSRSSCIRYVEILEDTLIAERIPVFWEVEDADTIKHPKLYFFDNGVLNGLLENFHLTQDRMGLLFEQFIYNIIKNSCIALDESFQISFFRTRHGVEVDFIVKLRGKIWAIEAKSGIVQKSDLKHIKQFKEYYPSVHKCIVVSPKEKRRSIDGILIGHWKDLLKEMKI